MSLRSDRSRTFLRELTRFLRAEKPVTTLHVFSIVLHTFYGHTTGRGRQDDDVITRLPIRRSGEKNASVVCRDTVTRFGALPDVGGRQNVLRTIPRALAITDIFDFSFFCTLQYAYALSILIPFCSAS